MTALVAWPHSNPITWLRIAWPHVTAPSSINVADYTNQDAHRTATTHHPYAIEALNSPSPLRFWQWQYILFYYNFFFFYSWNSHAISIKIISHKIRGRSVCMRCYLCIKAYYIEVLYIAWRCHKILWRGRLYATSHAIGFPFANIPRLVSGMLGNTSPHQRIYVYFIYSIIELAK